MTTLHLCGAGNAEGVRLVRKATAHDNRWDRLVILDDDEKRHGTELLGVPIIGSIDLLATAPPGSAAVNLVARTTASRAAVHRRIVGYGVPMPALVHPGVDATDCLLGEGALAYEQSVLSPLTEVGAGSVVFMRAIIGHDARVGAGCVIAAGAVLNARVVLEDRVYVGSNASILPDLRIGAGATIGANTLVATDVPAGATVIGVPGQIVTPTPAVATAASPDIQAAQPTQHTQNAVTAIEARLMELLHASLGHRNASPTDHFFDAGGTSLRAIQLVEAIRRELLHEVPLLVFYSRCSMREVAKYLAGDTRSEAAEAGQERAAKRRRMLGRNAG